MINLSKGQENFNGVSFVVKAKAKKHFKKELNYVYSDGKKIMATDGHRLHIFNQEFEPGFYDVIKSTKTNVILTKIDGEYFEWPDIERVIPKQIDSMPTMPKNIYNAYADIVRSFESGSLNFNYFEDIYNSELQFYQVVDNTTPVMFIGNNTKAVVMPTRQ